MTMNQIWICLSYHFFFVSFCILWQFLVIIVHGGLFRLLRTNENCVYEWRLLLSAEPAKCNPLLHTFTLQWHHNGRDGVSNQQHHHYLLNLADQRKHQSSASLAFVWRKHWGPVNSPHKWSVTRKMFPFHDVIISRQLRKHGRRALALSWRSKYNPFFTRMTDYDYIILNWSTT